MRACRCEAESRNSQVWPVAPIESKCGRVSRFRSLGLCTAMLLFAAMIVTGVGVMATSAGATSPFVPIWQNVASEPGGCSGPLTTGYSLSGSIDQSTIGCGWNSSGTVNFIWLQDATSVSYSFTTTSWATLTYGIPAGGYLNNAPAIISIDGSGPEAVVGDLGASGSTTPSDLYLWTDTLGPGTHTWTITSLGNAVNVYGLWVTTSTTPLCSTTNGPPWLSINPASVSGLEASINGGVMAPEGTSLTGIDWNWGDGTTETGCDYFPQSHTYAQSGQYTVVVTTTFTDGTDLQASETVTVTTPAYADILQAIGITQQLETEVASVPLLAAFAHLFQAMQGQLTADLAKVSSSTSPGCTSAMNTLSAQLGTDFQTFQNAKATMTAPFTGRKLLVILVDLGRVVLDLAETTAFVAGPCAVV